MFSEVALKVVALGEAIRIGLLEEVLLVLVVVVQ